MGLRMRSRQARRLCTTSEGPRQSVHHGAAWISVGAITARPSPCSAESSRNDAAWYQDRLAAD